MILLDTNAIIWAFNDLDRLGEQARAMIESAQDDSALCFSSLSLWEIAMLRRKNRLHHEREARQFLSGLKRTGLQEMPVTSEIAILAGELEGMHGDPADRIIIATALIEGMKLLTSDRKILAWDGPLKTVDARL